MEQVNSELNKSNSNNKIEESKSDIEEEYIPKKFKKKTKINNIK